MNIVKEAQRYATEHHRGTNHLYDEKPYEFHLQMVYDTAMKFIHLIPEEDRENVLAACWLHDVIEDCRLTYNDVLHAINKEVAELVYAVTNEKGKNRKERASDKFYADMHKVKHAVFVKACDRVANYEHSKNTKSRMADMYEREMVSFVKQIYQHQYGEIYHHLLSGTPKMN